MTTVANDPKIHEEVHSETHAGPLRTVCIAIDGSENSDFALDWSLKNILRQDDQVILLNVRPFVSLPTLSYGAPFIDYGEAFSQVEEGNKKVSHELLIHAARVIKEKGLHVRAIALRGDAREELVYKVAELKADMVIIGSRGLGPFKRAFLGSVSDYLSHNLEVPVIITRKPAEVKK